MGRWELWFVWLLTQAFHINSEETLVKTIGSEPDLTPVCDNSTLEFITLIVCKIRTERNREECRLVYQLGQGFKHECDPRFTLMTDNQTVFLHLTSLTPVDSGNITCQCSDPDGTFILHLNVTVEEGKDDSSSAEVPFVHAVAGVLVFIIITGVILGVLHRNTRHRGRQETPTSYQTVEPQNIRAYITFIQRENELYSAV